MGLETKDGVVQLNGYLPSDSFSNPNDIEKSHVTSAFKYGQQKITFKKKGSEIKGMAKTKKAQYESLCGAYKQKALAIKKELIDSCGDAVKFNENGRVDYDYDQVDKEKRKLIYSYNDSRWKYQDMKEEISVLDSIIDNIEDNKSYELTLEQVHALNPMSRDRGDYGNEISESETAY